METKTTSGPQEQPHVDKPQAQTEQQGRGRKRGLLIGGGLFLVVLCALVTVWAIQRADEPKRAAVRQAQEERDQARSAEAKAKKQLDEETAARQTAAVQRNQAVAAENAARRSQQINKTVLAFLKNNLLSSGDPKGWRQVAAGKDVTLLQAVNAAEPKVAQDFTDRPLAEASVRQILGTTYLDLGEADKAVQQFERSMALWEAILGPDHPNTGDCRNQLAVAYRRDGRIEDASRLFQQSPLSSTHAAALAIQGSALLAEGKPADAELKLRESVAIRQRIQPDDWTTFAAQSTLAAALMEQKKYAAAERHLLSAYEGMKQRQAKIPHSERDRFTRALDRLVHLYEAWGKPDKAAQWRKELEAVESPRKH